MTLKAAKTDDALEYATKYACIQTFSFGHIVSDALNEKGLMGSILYLENATLPPTEPGRKEIAPNNFIPYAVSNGNDEDAMSNEPFYNVHKAFDEYDYQPTGTIKAIDCRARAHRYLRDMHKRNVVDPDKALMAMRGLMATVLAGTEEIDPVFNAVFPTQWWGTADLNAGKYYITRIESWCAEIYDFSMFDPAKAELVDLTPKASPYPDIPLKK